MLNKRLIGVVNVKDGWAVQSFGYNTYLPMGKPEILVENLDRWGADEILVQVIDRSVKKLGPDFSLIEKIGNLGISTPIVYGGGIRDEQDAISAIKRGADRISINHLFFKNPESVRRVAHCLGAQAIIASLPLHCINGVIKHYDYIAKKSYDINEDIKSLIDDNLISELLISDWVNEGTLDKFNIELLKARELTEYQLIAFGGLGDPLIGEKVIGLSNVAAIAVGNPFSYQEHAIQAYNKQLKSTYLRSPYFRDEKSYEWN